MKNREIKFRVWDKLNREFCDWVAIGLNGIIFGCSFTYKNLSEFSGSPICGLDQKRFIAEQFTGLKDKNKREIYEGDIFDFGGPEVEDVVSVLWIGSEAAWGLSDGMLLSDYDLNEAEVIGNIHENPELLEAGK